MMSACSTCICVLVVDSRSFGYGLPKNIEDLLLALARSGIGESSEICGDPLDIKAIADRSTVNSFELRILSSWLDFMNCLNMSIISTVGDVCTRQS